MEPIQNERKYTYEDYLTWPDDVRYELIDGVAYSMASPNDAHQTLSMELAGRLWSFMRGKPCKVYAAPYDLRFTEDRKAGDVVQPDVMVVCEKEKRRPEGIVGAPSLIVEIGSPSTAMIDFTMKKKLYERNGVCEYWIIAPPVRTITQYVLTDGVYIETLHQQGTIESTSLSGFTIDLDELFAELTTAND